MAPNLPGFYWDEMKKRYYKIESSTTAPPGAAWSDQNVKRRKVEDAKAEEKEKEAKIHDARVQRSVELTDQLVGGPFRRELGYGGGGGGGHGAGWFSDHQFREFGRVADLRDYAAAAYARGIREKGYIDMTDRDRRYVVLGAQQTIDCLYVDGSDTKTDLGVAFSNYGTEFFKGWYIPRNCYDHIPSPKSAEHYEIIASRCPALVGRQSSVIRVPQMSSIKYHGWSNKMLMTSRDPDPTTGAGLYHFTPNEYRAYGFGPRWDIYNNPEPQHMHIRAPSSSKAAVVHACTPAPPSSNGTFCILGTDHGVVQVLDPNRSGGPDTQRYLATETKSPARAKPYSERHPTSQTITTVEYLMGTSQVLLAAGRAEGVWLADLREPPQTCWHRAATTGSSTAHVRSVTHHHVLAAGPHNRMAVFDVRFPGIFTASSFLQPPPEPRPEKFHTGSPSPPYRRKIRNFNFNPLTTPILTFDEYRNEAWLGGIGLDVDTSLSIAAAAHDDGTVHIYSLLSGRRLPCPELDRVRAPGSVGFPGYPPDPYGRPGVSNIAASSAGEGAAGGGGVIKALQFGSLPFDRNPSLFVGIGHTLHKFSFGVRYGPRGEVLED